MTRRVFTALLGILLLLAGEAPLVAWATQSAAMDCCPDGHACCRRLHHRTQTGPAWQGDMCGMPGCGGGAFSTVSAQLQAGVAQAVHAQLIVLAELALLFACLTVAFVQFKPELFQRPPPAVL